MNSAATTTNNVTAIDSRKSSSKQELIAANIKLLIEQLEAGRSDTLTNYLTAMSRFHNYIQLYHGNASLLAEGLEVIQQTASVILAALEPPMEAKDSAPSRTFSLRRWGHENRPQHSPEGGRLAAQRMSSPGFRAPTSHGKFTRGRDRSVAR